MNYCKTCKHWERPFRQEGRHYNKGYLDGGFCENEGKWFEGYNPSDEYPQDVMIYSYAEGGSFWTGPNFGCVHHEPKP